MLPLNKVVNKTSNEWVDNFALCVEGQLNEASLGFLRSVAKSNPAGLQKLISKFQQLQLHLKADAVHMVIHALADQLNIPRDAMATIRTFLQDENKQTLFKELQAMSDTQSPLQQSVLHIMNHLAIFNETSPASEFLRLIMIIMMDWSSNHVHRTPKDAAKWINTMLSIPYKSDMSHIIHLITDHFHLSECLIDGISRNMDCLELFFLLQNLTQDTDLVLVAETNKKMIVNIHATMLTVMICKHSPSAFYDVVALQEQHPEYTVLSILKSYQATPLELESFFQNPETGFKEYYCQKDHGGNHNHHIFMSSLMTKIHSTLSIQPNSTDEQTHTISVFFTNCQEKLREMGLPKFIAWFKENANVSQFEPLLHTLLFDAVFDAALSHKSCHAGRIRASALQLVSLGFSHRSAASLTTGIFQPLVNTDIASIDAKNMESMAIYFHQLSPETRLKLTQELLLSTILYAYHLNITPQTQAKNISQKAQTLTQLNTATVDMVPKKVRPNPLHRDRLFTPKIPVSQESLRQSTLVLSKQ